MAKGKILSDEELIQVEALAAYLSSEQIADYFGIGRRTFYAIMKRQPEVAARYKKGRARAIGIVAQGLLTDAREGNLTAKMFYLKTQAGWRETNRKEDMSTISKIVKSTKIMNIKTTEDAITALQIAVENKLNVMLSQPGTINFKIIQEIEKAITIISKLKEKYKSNNKGQVEGGISDEAADMIRQQILGVVKNDSVVP